MGEAVVPGHVSVKAEGRVGEQAGWGRERPRPGRSGQLCSERPWAGWSMGRHVRTLLLEGSWRGSPCAVSQVYKGYVDDPRNTDNAWIETVAVSIHFSDQSDVELKRLNSVWGSGLRLRGGGRLGESVLWRGPGPAGRSLTGTRE